jgi:hypothetical protein
VRSIVVLLIVAASCAPNRSQTAAPATGVLLTTCSAPAADADQDGFTDDCELSLATRFAPFLNASAAACNVIGSADSRKLGGGYLYAVAPGARGGARIAYLPAYFRDCGWEGVKCRFPGIDCAPHAGDSEIVIVDVQEHGASTWSVTGVFLSAHCFGRSDASCRWYRGPELARFSWRHGLSGGPTVWVANGRNANYPTRSACEDGHWMIDTCSGERFTFAFPVLRASNIGSRAHPGVTQGCITATAVDPSGEHTAHGASECFWNADTRFKGWQNAGDGVTPYNRYLQLIAGW